MRIPTKLRKTLLAGVGALTVAGTMAVSTAPAEAQWWGWGYRPYYRPYYGGALAAGLVGGLALGALAARPYYYGYPGYYSYGYPGPYARPVVYGGGGCWFERRVRITPYGERIVRRVRVCG